MLAAWPSGTERGRQSNTQTSNQGLDQDEKSGNGDKRQLQRHFKGRDDKISNFKYHLNNRNQIMSNP